MPNRTLTVADGGTFTVRSVGDGPGIVVVHGGAVTHREYVRLARALSDRFTVHLYDRRGRGDAPRRTGGYTVDADVEDLAAILEATGARHVFGHSYGGFVALRAALSLPVERVAVYDPTVSVDGGFPSAFFEPFAAAVDAGDLSRAFAVMSRGIEASGAASRLPLGIQTAVSRLFLRTPIGRSMGALLPTVVPEDREVFAHDGPAADWAGITVPALLAYGARSPRYYAPMCAALADAMPAATARAVPRSSHNAANIARPPFVRLFADFFAAPAAA
jgi:pimeloyl-ACP methyl ester carboxylesterase